MRIIIAFIILCSFNLDLIAQGAFTLTSSPAVGHTPWSLTAADVNGDGKPDMITANTADNTLTVLTNNGSGGFGLASSPAVGNDPWTVVSADFNGDGKIDLVSVNFNDNTLTVLTNNGHGGFVTASTPSVGARPISVAAADVNGDGKLDLITANSIDNTLTVLTNAGGGRFVLASSPGVGANPWAVAAGDVNGDGKMDLISANTSDNSLTVLTNSGGGHFVLASTLGVGFYPLAVMATDINGDGKVDLISANWSSSTLTVLTNDGSGRFVTASTPNAGNPRAFTAGDINADGKVDLICVNYNANTLTVLTNAGKGVFGPSASLSVGYNPYAVVAVDVNGDGLADLVNANASDNTLSVLTYTLPAPPLITSQPLGYTNIAGSSALFNITAVTAFGTINYQWRLNGTNLPAATSSSLSLTNITVAQAGVYDVVISNYVGSVTSSPAILSVSFILASVNGQPALGAATALASAQISIAGGYPGGFLFYTLDGSIPTTSSILYTGPISLTNTAVVQVIGLSSDFSQQSSVYAVTVQVIPVYNLQTSVSGSGTISVNPASGPYPSNSVVTLTATAATNWAFANWTGSASGSQNPLNVTINGPSSVQAVFVPTAFPLTVSTPGGGSVTASGQTIAPATYFPAGSVVTLNASPSNGWSFLGWQGSTTSANNPLNATINQTNNLKAIFGTVVTNNTVGGGSIVLNQPNPIPYGTVVTASAVPNNGKYFVAWSGSASGTSSPTGVTVTNALPGINGLFSSLPGGKYSLAVVVAGNGSVSINPQQTTYNPGDMVTLTATTTNAGTSFSGWTGSVTTTNSVVIVTMDTNKVVQANFGAAPSVSISPLNLTVLAGSNAVLTASAAGLPPLTYQWQNSQGFLTGQTNATLTISNAQATNSDNYSVVVVNSFGSVTSLMASVTVVFPPTITLPPLPQTLAAGTSLGLSVQAAGTAPLAYQWQNSTGSITGATNSTLNFNPAVTNQTDAYSVVVSNAYGAVTSSVANVLVYLPVSIQTPPVSHVVTAQSPVAFTVAASGFPAPTTYQWILNGTNLPGTTSSSLTLLHVRLADLGNYQVMVGNGYSTITSDPVALVMAPSLVSAFGGATTIWGESATLAVGAIGSGSLSYQWYQNGALIDGATGATLNFGSIQFTNAGLYSVVVTSLYGSITNTAAQVIVNPAGLAVGFCPALTITGVVGYSYVIQSTASLADTNGWLTLTNLTLTQPVQIWVDTSVEATSPFNPKYFYRVLPGQ